MPYVVMARKWRPGRFEDVVGQTHVRITLQNALQSGRIAHAYLFAGPRGVGKTTMARILAKALNCKQGPTPTPCNACSFCEAISKGTSLDVLEIDGASNRGIDEIRDLRGNIQYAPAQSRYKIYYIDEVHMLTREAFNALLKTLEEPPGHVVFVFATTEPRQLPPTILSRCQRFDFRRISLDLLQERLSLIGEHEALQIDPDALRLIAQKADGSMRDAESLLDQLASFGEGRITAAAIREVLGLVDEEMFLRLTEAIHEQDLKKGLDLVEEALEGGAELTALATGCTEHLRNLLLTKVEGEATRTGVSEAVRGRYEEQAEWFAEEDVLRMIQVLLDLNAVLPRSPQPRLRLEMAVARLVKMEPSVRLREVLEKLSTLEQKWTGVHPGAPSEPTDTAMPPRRSPPVAPDPAPPKGRPAKHAEFGEEAAEEGSSAPDLGEGPVERPSSPKASPTLECVLERWPRILEEVRRRKISMGSLLAEGKPVHVSNGALEIAFGRDGAFHVRSIMRSRHIVEEVLKECFQGGLRIQCAVSEEEATSQNATSARPSNPRVEASEGMYTREPILQAVVDVFDGEIVRG